MGEPGVEHEVARLADRLRRRGSSVTTRQLLSFVEGLAATGGGHAREVAMATLAVSPADADAVLDVLGAPEPPDPTGSQDPAGTSGGDGAEFSAVEVLRTRDLAACTDAERVEIHRRLARVSLAGPARRSRRWARADTARVLDLRETARAAARTGGEVAGLVHRTRRLRPRRVVLLLDVSGSMEPYARTLLHLGHVGVRGRAHVEVFALGTRLSRLTRPLSSADPDTAFAAAVAAAPDWGSGTRLGADVRQLLDDPTTNGLVRGAVVVVVSDGLDRGDPSELGRQMQRLARHAHRVVWVNPLRATEGYEPVAAGMAAALPHVDHFLEGHSLDSFEHLAAVVAARADRTQR